MNVDVRYFASLVDYTGVASERVEVGVGDGVEQLWSLVVSRHPRLDELGFRPMVACDMEYASWDRKLEGVHEVAFLPPVSGG
jgi:molybdopterin converting factor small subunit